MKVNFRRLGQGPSGPASTIIDPRDLFNALPERVSGLDYLRGPQDQVLSAWHERRAERDLVIKMNTGGGKTMVGLLIARSWLNEGIWPVAYLVPDDFLTAQVTAEARRAGIATTSNPKSPEYQQGRAVLVGTFAKLFNGLSVFGVGGSASKPPSHALAGVVFDDAHACIAQIDEVFRLRVEAGSSAYSELLGLFADDIKGQSISGYMDLESGNKRAIHEIPFWAWQAKQDQVLSILHPLSNDELKWGWPLLVDSLPLCTGVVTSESFEIIPPCHPTEELLGFSRAQRRVYLTATLADDSALVRHFDAAPESVSLPIFPSSAGDIGDRMMLVPQQLVPKATDDEVRELVLDLAEDQNVVVIVPSHARADWWREYAALVLDRSNIHHGVEHLHQNPQLGLVVLINRYDGVDLPGDACHVLVIDGLPEALNGPERLAQARLTGSENLLGRQIQRLEQGMGRATRSNEDHAVVLLLGARLAERLNTPGAREFFAPATRVQLDIAVDIASEIEASTLSDLHDVMEQCLGREKDWIAYSKGALAEVRYDVPVVIDTASAERRAFANAMRVDYMAAAKEQQAVVNDMAADPATQAFHKQRLAAYTNFFDPSQAQQTQKSANYANRRLLRPLGGVQYERLNATSLPQGQQAASALQKRYRSGNDLLLGVNAMMQDLEWGSRTEQFEQAMRDLADHIGHTGQRPEQLPKPGPDGLWALCDGNFYVIEAKSDADSGHPVYKKWAAQLSQAMDWFREQYPSSQGTPLLIHPWERFDPNAAIPRGCRVITTERLKRLKKEMSAFSEEVASNESFRDPNRVNSLLNYHGLDVDTFISRFTVNARY